jgi:multidrug efflux system membrane fusion protein
VREILVLKRFVQKNTVILAGAAILLMGCSKQQTTVNAGAPPQQPVISVRALNATSADVPLEISAIGNVEAITTVDVKSRATAPVLRVDFSEGQDVTKGDLLFELDPDTWNRQIDELEANIGKDVAAEKQAEANIVRDQVTMKNAQSVAERGVELAKQGIFSREQTDQVVATADAAKATIEADRAAIESARAAEKADSARLEQTKLQLTYTKIYAPITGRVGTINIKAGNLAKENDAALVQILQTTPVYVSFAVPEDLLPEVRRYNASSPLMVHAITADNKQSTGTLQFIDNSVDATTGTIRLKASFDNQQRALWPGQFVNVRATLSVEHGRVVVASRTVQTGPDGKYVWVVSPGDSTVAMRNVTVARTFTPAGQQETAVIDSGLKAGEQVVSEGQLRLTPGARVKLLAASATSSS